MSRTSKMSSAAKSLFLFGIYAVAAGTGLLLVPGLLLATLGFPPVNDGWVRVVGSLAMIVGAYHIVGARHNLLPYIRASVWGRVAFAVLLASLVVAYTLAEWWRTWVLNQGIIQFLILALAFWAVLGASVEDWSGGRWERFTRYVAAERPRRGSPPAPPQI